MATDVTTLGPPMEGPGCFAETLGFASSASARPGAYSNRGPLPGNLLCHKKNVERNHAIHENRLASAKASLSLGSPLRPKFMVERLSKKFHVRENRERVICENLRLLQKMRDIYSRGDQDYYRSSKSTRCSQEKPVPDSVSGIKATSSAEERGKGVVTSSSSSMPFSHKLNILVARRRNAEAALLETENRKMLKRIKQSKSLYSRKNLRKHNKTHLRILRLRKTDYTAGHLLASTTTMRHWAGGNPRDDGFSYSFEEDRGHRRGNQTRYRGCRGTTGGSASSLSTSFKVYLRSAGLNKSDSFYSPSPSHKFDRWNGFGVVQNGAKSAPCLPSLAADSYDIYGGGNLLSSPDLEQCQLAKEKLLIDGGQRGGVVGVSGGSDGSRGSSRKSIVSFAQREDGDRKRRSDSTGGLSGGGGGSSDNRRGGSHQRGSSWQRIGGVNGSKSARATRGTDSRVDAVSTSYTSSWESSGTNPRTVSRMSSRTHSSRQLMKRKEGKGVRKSGRRSPKSSGKDPLNDVDEGKIPNPFVLPGQNDGVRVLVQATMPLEDFDGPGGEPWVCFIRIVAKDPFDDKLDVIAILDREEICRRVLSLKEAYKICEGADEAVMLCNQPVKAGESAIRGANISSPCPELASFEKSAGREISQGVNLCSMTEESLGELLTRMFVEADAEGKGHLTPEQLRSMMHHANLGLSGLELQIVIAEADKDADGSIDYCEFVPMVYNLVRAFRARRKACEEIPDASLYLDEKAIHALYDTEFGHTIKQLQDLCESCDEHGTGALPQADLMKCISSLDRSGGLTKIESKLLLSVLPRDSQGNVIYDVIGAALEQVRFTTLRKTIAEEGTTDTERYLLCLCREEVSKSEVYGSKTHLKHTGDSITGVGGSGGNHSFGVLRARQLTKLLLDAPLLSLTRLHVTALMSQVHTVDGMVDYIELVPMMAKAIEGIFPPQCLKMRHEIFKRVEGIGRGVNAKGTAGLTEGGANGAPAVVVRRTRDDVQKLFIDVLEDENVGENVFERLKDPEAFAKCMAALDLDAKSDAVNALWEATRLGNRQDATFLDMVDFCFTCALLFDREKQLKDLHQTSMRISTMPRSASPRRQNLVTTVVAAVTAATSGADIEKQDSLLRLARILARQAKVTCQTQGRVDLEFFSSEEEDNTAGDGTKGQPHRDTNRTGKEGGGIVRGAYYYSDGNKASLYDGAQYNGAEADQNIPTVGSRLNAPRNGDQDAEKTNATGVFEGQLRSEAQDTRTLYKTRRRGVPFIDPSGQPITRSMHCELEPIGGSSDIDPGTFREKDEGTVIHVYWEGENRDRAFVEAYAAEDVSVGREGDPRKCLRLGVRMPTLAVVDAKAATFFAERIAEQVVIEVYTDSGSMEGEEGEMLQKEEEDGQQKEKMRLRLVGADAKAVFMVT